MQITRLSSDSFGWFKFPSIRNSSKFTERTACGPARAQREVFILYRNTVIPVYRNTPSDLWMKVLGTLYTLFRVSRMHAWTSIGSMDRSHDLLYTLQLILGVSMRWCRVCSQRTDHARLMRQASCIHSMAPLSAAR